ncbi:MAG: hypothetical protein RCG15_00640 [Candidatus Rickettsia vulgarisii]
MERRVFVNHVNDVWSRATEYTETSKERYSIVSRGGEIPTQMEVGITQPKAITKKSNKGKFV